jgi:hypothetical protein
MAPRLALLTLALAVLPAGSISSRAAQSPTAPDAIAWFDTLGYPNAKDLPYVRVATGSWVQTADQPRSNQFVEGFLIREDGDSFTVFLCNVASSFALGADDVGDRSFAPLTTVRFVRKDSGPVSEQVRYQRLEFRTVANDVLDRVRQHTSIDDGALFDSIWQPVTHRARIFAFARACLQNGLSEVGARLLQIAADIPIGQTGRVDPGKLRELLQQQLGDAVLNQAEADATVAKVPWNELSKAYSRFESRFPASDRVAYAREAAETLQRMIAEDAAHESKPLAQMSPDEQAAENIYQLRNFALAPPYWSTGGPYPVAFERRDGKDVPTPVHRLVDLGFSAVPRLIAALDDHTFTRSQVARFKGYELPRAMRVSDFARNILSFMSGRNFSQWLGSDGTPIAGTVRERAEAWWAEVRRKG